MFVEDVKVINFYMDECKLFKDVTMTLNTLLTMMYNEDSRLEFSDEEYSKETIEDFKNFCEVLSESIENCRGIYITGD